MHFIIEKQIYISADSKTNRDIDISNELVRDMPLE